MSETKERMKALLRAVPGMKPRRFLLGPAVFDEYVGAILGRRPVDGTVPEPQDEYRYANVPVECSVGHGSHAVVLELEG
jgi:hypothetical protein